MFSASCPTCRAVQNDAAALRLGAALDVNLYRQDAGTLKTDNSLRVGNNLIVNNELFAGTPSVNVLAGAPILVWLVFLFDC